VIISHVRLFMIISHVKIITFLLSFICKNYRFSKTVLYIINRKIHWCLEIPDLFLVLNMHDNYHVQHSKYIWYFHAHMYYSLFNLKFVNSPAEQRSLKIILTNIQHPLFLWFTFSQESTRTTRRRR
jgi:hypothetical protein